VFIDKTVVDMYMHDGNTVVKQATTVFLEPVINSIFLINLSHSML